MEQAELRGQLETVDRSLFFLTAVAASVLLSFWSVGIQRRELAGVISGCPAEGLPEVFPIKLTAGALAAGALFLLLCAVTLAAYFTLWDYRGVWGASVSSQFNYITELLVRRPFLPWADFTVGGYLAAAVALGTLFCGACALLAGLIGALTPNVYSAALLLVLLLLGGTYLQTLAAQEGAWQGYFLLNLQPTATWLSLSGWFTELGLSALVPWQETKATLLCLALFAGGGALAAWFLARKDVS